MTNKPPPQKINMHSNGFLFANKVTDSQRIPIEEIIAKSAPIIYVT